MQWKQHGLLLKKVKQEVARKKAWLIPPLYEYARMGWASGWTTKARGTKAKPKCSPS
jgi:hypothetical protein